MSGSSKTQDKNSEYYRRKLPKSVRTELKKSIKNRDTIIVGDALGMTIGIMKILEEKEKKEKEKEKELELKLAAMDKEISYFWNTIFFGNK